MFGRVSFEKNGTQEVMMPAVKNIERTQ